MATYKLQCGVFLTVSQGSLEDRLCHHPVSGCHYSCFYWIPSISVLIIVQKYWIVPPQLGISKEQHASSKKGKLFAFTKKLC